MQRITLSKLNSSTCRFPEEASIGMRAIYEAVFGKFSQEAGQDDDLLTIDVGPRTTPIIYGGKEYDFLVEISTNWTEELEMKKGEWSRELQAKIERFLPEGSSFCIRVNPSKPVFITTRPQLAATA